MALGFFFLSLSLQPLPGSRTFIKTFFSELFTSIKIPPGLNLEPQISSLLHPHHHHQPISISRHPKNLPQQDAHTSSAMANLRADDILSGFDVPDHDKQFLLEVLTHPGTPREEKLAIFDLSLLSGFEDWCLWLECAASIRDNTPRTSELDARDVLAFVPRVNEATRTDEEIRKGWAATDQSIKNLARLLRFQRSTITPESQQPQPAASGHEQPIVKKSAGNKRQRKDDPDDEANDHQRRRVKRQQTPKPSTSHYFAHATDDQSSQYQPLATPAPTHNAETRTSAVTRNGVTKLRRTPRNQAQNKAAMGASGSDPQHSASEAGSTHGKNDDAGALKAERPLTARDLRAKMRSWPTRRKTPSPTTSSELSSPVDLSPVKSEM